MGWANCEYGSSHAPTPQRPLLRSRRRYNGAQTEPLNASWRVPRRLPAPHLTRCGRDGGGLGSGSLSGVQMGCRVWIRVSLVVGVSVSSSGFFFFYPCLLLRSFGFRFLRSGLGSGFFFLLSSSPFMESLQYVRTGFRGFRVSMIDCKLGKREGTSSSSVLIVVWRGQQPVVRDVTP